MEWANPRLLSVLPFAPHDFATLHANRHILPDTTEAQYTNALKRLSEITDVTVKHIMYEVNGLKVTGAMLTPNKMEAKAHPILIYNRGGSGQFGILTAWNMVLLSHYAREGYIVFASNYRGNDGGEGQEEFGGADVQDVLVLHEMARTHPSWDGKNSYMYGHSRGGMMTLLAIKQGATLNAAVSVAGPTYHDSREQQKRPDMLKIYRRLIPDFDANAEAELAARSAVNWVDALNVPLLILQGDIDTRVDVTHATELDAALIKADKPHKTIIYKGGDHSLTRYRKESMEEIRQWFLKYKVS